MKTKRTQAQIIRSEAMPSMRLWEICPTAAYARQVAKRYNFKDFLVCPVVLDGESFFALYILR